MQPVANISYSECIKFVDRDLLAQVTCLVIRVFIELGLIPFVSSIIDYK